MSHIRRSHWLFILSSALLMVAAALLWPQARAEAQCGSQASSCKNCHEVQAKKPVNNDGKSWHQSHAFGDFCANCHGGNVQAVDEAAAHMGLVAPLSDIKANCAACHPSDTQARAQKYATILGVSIGSSSSSSPAATPTPVTPVNTSGGAGSAASVAPSAALVVNDPNTVDYVQHYREAVLGQHPINWGNVILAVLNGLLLVGGGTFILYHEGWIAITTRPIRPVPVGYPQPTVDLLPELSRLDAHGLDALGQLLKRPGEAAQLFQSLARYTAGGQRGAGADAVKPDGAQ